MVGYTKSVRDTGILMTDLKSASSNWLESAVRVSVTKKGSNLLPRVPIV